MNTSAKGGVFCTTTSPRAINDPDLLDTVQRRSRSRRKSRRREPRGYSLS